MPIFILFVLYVLADLIALLLLGHLVGVLPTLLLILVTGIAGIRLIKTEGVHALRKVQISMMQGQVNKRELLLGSSSVISGFLLFLPGPISDLLGLICLIPMLNRKVRKDDVEPYHPGFDPNARTFDSSATRDENHTSREGTTIEGEVIEHDTPDRR
ncbi:hypothetical protein LMG33818_000548 [Halomonadaceae bacterium LMG 33818]|uniref:FxsA family protein n=1 Tax=Cernens ardua TaxID=3402176 RepID=UPI003EDC7802